MNDCQPLTPSERETLCWSQVCIASGLSGIRDGALYREWYPDFGTYCRVYWGLDAGNSPGLSGPASIFETLGLSSSPYPAAPFDLPDFSLNMPDSDAPVESRPTSEQCLIGFREALVSGQPRAQLLPLAVQVWLETLAYDNGTPEAAANELAGEYIAGVLRELLTIALPVPAEGTTLQTMKARIALNTIARFMDELQMEGTA